MERLDCSRCAASCDISDNFCRKCGQALVVTLPAVATPAALPAVPQRAVSIPPAVMRGVAVLALSTGVEWAMRRMAGGAAKAAGRALIPGAASSGKQLKGSRPREVSVDEIVYVRKVQLRR